MFEFLQLKNEPNNLFQDRNSNKPLAQDEKRDEQRQEQQNYKGLFTKQQTQDDQLDQKSEAIQSQVNEQSKEVVAKQNTELQSDNIRKERLGIFADLDPPNYQQLVEKNMFEKIYLIRYMELQKQQKIIGQSRLYTNQQSKNSQSLCENNKEATQLSLLGNQSSNMIIPSNENQQHGQKQSLDQTQLQTQSQSSLFGLDQQQLSNSFNQQLTQGNPLLILEQAGLQNQQQQQQQLQQLQNSQNPRSTQDIVNDKAVLSKQHSNQAQTQRKQIQPLGKVIQQSTGFRQNQQNQEYLASILQQILYHKLHYNPNYTRIYGIKHDVQYLRDVKRNFENHYSDFIKFLQGKQTLIRWYEGQIKVFHQQFGVPVIIDSFWQNYHDNSQIFTVQCRLELFNSDPFKNFTQLRDNYLLVIYEQINLQDDISKQKFINLLELSLKPQIVDIHLIYLLSLISGMNVMVHEDQIPTKEPILIANGREVSNEYFPNFNIIQLYTTDFKLYYYIIPSTLEDKTKLDQYIHYDVRMQEINYTEVAQQMLKQLQKRENEREQNINNFEGENNLDKMFKSIEKKIQNNINQYEQQKKLENTENSKDFQEVKVERKQEDLD